MYFYEQNKKRTLALFPSMPRPCLTCYVVLLFLCFENIVDGPVGVS